MTRQPAMCVTVLIGVVLAPRPAAASPPQVRRLPPVCRPTARPMAGTVGRPAAPKVAARSLPPTADRAGREHADITARRHVPGGS